MAITLSTALASRQAQQLAQALTGGFIRIFAGPRPDSADMAEPSEPLAIVTTRGVTGAGLTFQAGGASVTKSAYPWAFKGLAAGTATWFRVVGPADDGRPSISQVRIDGDIGTPDNPGDMTWENPAIEAGSLYSLDTFVYLINP